MGLQHTSVSDLEATIRCSIDTGHAIPIAELRLARDAEAAGTGARISIIKLLDREIKRQEKVN